MASFGKSDSDSGMNWTFTKDIVRKMTATTGPDTAPSAAEASRMRDAVGLADLWLDEEIAFPRLSASVQGVEPRGLGRQHLRDLAEARRPVVTSLSTALGSLMAREAGPGEEFMKPMVRVAASGMFAAQVGQSLGSLAADVLSVSDIGLPLGERPQVALLPSNIEEFGAGLENVTAADVLLFLALRETARQRLFAAVGWLGPQLHALVEHYARDITIDTAALGEAIESQLSAAMSADDLERAGQTLAGKLFEPAVTDEQKEVLARLETLLALVEGWVDEVVGHTMSRWMPNGAALTEVVRRRRAAGGPAESALKSLVGLELRPRRTRDAANLWAAIRAGATVRPATRPGTTPT